MAIISPRILAAATGNKAAASPEIAAITTGSSSVSAPKIFALSTFGGTVEAGIAADTARTIPGRYTNRGVNDGRLFTSGTEITNEPASTKTGTCITATTSSDVITPATLGFGDINELWIRFDNCKKSSDIKIKVYFDGAAGNDYVGLGNYVYYGKNGANSGYTSWGYPAFGRWVMHVSPTDLQLYFDDKQAFSRIGLEQGKKVTGIKIDSTTDRLSNFIIANYDCSAETLETTSVSAAISADAARLVTARTDLAVDTRRIAAAADEISAETNRQLLASGISKGDSLRNVNAFAALSADAVRYITSDNAAVLLADTARAVAASDSVRGAADRTLVAGETAAATTVRNLSADVSITADTSRCFGIAVSLQADTIRSIKARIQIVCDTSRAIPFVDNGTSAGFAIQSIRIAIQPQSISESFTMATTEKMEVLDAIRGRILDYDYSYTVEQTQWQGIVQQVQGMIDVDQTLYTPFKYETSGGGKMASHHAERIADAIGKHLDAHFDDFQPSSDLSGTGATYQNLISTLWGWTSRVPRRLINAYIRNDTLRIIQRGCELNRIDVTNTEHTVPNYAHKIVRSVWSGDGNAGAHSDDDSLDVGPMYFTGTISGPHGSMSYSNGLLTNETHDANTTTYSYMDVEDGYMTGKRTTNEDGTVIETTYNYAGVIGNKYLESEEEYTKQPDQELGEKETIKMTYHRYLGNGWWETSVYQDGEYQGASMGQGVAGSKASRFVREEAMHFAGRPSGGSGILVDTEFPVIGRDFLETLTHEIEDFNRCIEETVSMVIYNYGHLIDYTDRVVYDGQEYFLESNEYSRDPRTEKQSITLVRWFKR